MKNPTIFKQGEANSSFAETLTERLQATYYLVVDNGQYGLDLMQDQTDKFAKINATFGDKLSLSASISNFDIVVSVGWMEHFIPDLVGPFISIQFPRCQLNDIALLMFPTLELLY